MKKMITIMSLLLISSTAFSSVVTEQLQNEEVSLAIELSNNHLVPLEGDVCSKTQFKVTGTTKGFNRTNWKLISSRAESALTDTEIHGVIKLVDRLAVPLTTVDPITTETRIAISGSTCGFNPTIWTVSFENQKN